MMYQQILMSCAATFYAFGAMASLPSRCPELRSQVAELKKAFGSRFLTVQDWGGQECRYHELVKDGTISPDRQPSLISLHHTVTGHIWAKQGIIPSDIEKQIVRHIQRRHRSRKMADVAYHFLIGQSGLIFQGRPLGILGAHSGGLNKGNIGISFIGCFDEEGCTQEKRNVTKVTDAMIESAAELLAFLADKYGMDLSESTVVSRAAHDLKRLKSETFRFSPGKAIEKRIPEMIRKAHKLRMRRSLRSS